MIYFIPNCNRERVIRSVVVLFVDLTLVLAMSRSCWVVLFRIMLSLLVKLLHLFTISQVNRQFGRTPPSFAPLAPGSIVASQKLAIRDPSARRRVG